MDDDVDIYADLPSFSLKNEKKDQNCNCKELKKEFSSLVTELENVQRVKGNLQKNLSSLLKTARAEISRKDKMIDDLRKRLDDVTFRRGNKSEASGFSTYRLSHQRTVPKKCSLYEDVASIHLQDSETELHGIEFHHDEYKSKKPEIEVNRIPTLFGERLQKRITEDEEEKKQKALLNLSEETKTKTIPTNNVENDKENGSQFSINNNNESNSGRCSKSEPPEKNPYKKNLVKRKNEEDDICKHKRLKIENNEDKIIAEETDYNFTQFHLTNNLAQYEMKDSLIKFEDRPNAHSFTKEKVPFCTRARRRATSENRDTKQDQNYTNGRKNNTKSSSAWDYDRNDLINSLRNFRSTSNYVSEEFNNYKKSGYRYSPPRRSYSKSRSDYESLSSHRLRERSSRTYREKKYDDYKYDSQYKRERLKRTYESEKSEKTRCKREERVLRGRSRYSSSDAEDRESNNSYKNKKYENHRIKKEKETVNVLNDKKLYKNNKAAAESNLRESCSRTIVNSTTNYSTKKNIEQHKVKNESEIKFKNSIELEIKSKNSIESEIKLKNSIESEIKSKNSIESEIKSKNLIESEIKSKNLIESDIKSKNLIDSEIESKNSIESEIKSKNSIESEVKSKNLIESDIKSKNLIDSEIESKNSIESEVKSKNLIKSEIKSKNLIDSEIESENSTESTSAPIVMKDLDSLEEGEILDSPEKKNNSTKISKDNKMEQNVKSSLIKDKNEDISVNISINDKSKLFQNDTNSIKQSEVVDINTKKIDVTLHLLKQKNTKDCDEVIQLNSNKSDTAVDKVYNYKKNKDTCKSYINEDLINVIRKIQQMRDIDSNDKNDTGKTSKNFIIEPAIAVNETTKIKETTVSNIENVTKMKELDDSNIESATKKEEMDNSNIESIAEITGENNFNSNSIHKIDGDELKTSTTKVTKVKAVLNCNIEDKNKSQVLIENETFYQMSNKSKIEICFNDHNYVQNPFINVSDLEANQKSSLKSECGEAVVNSVKSELPETTMSKEMKTEETITVQSINNVKKTTSSIVKNKKDQQSKGRLISHRRKAVILSDSSASMTVLMNTNIAKTSSIINNCNDNDALKSRACKISRVTAKASCK